MELDLDSEADRRLSEAAPVEVQRRPFPLVCLGKGATSFEHKMEALLWALLLDTAGSDPEHSVKCYARNVISVTTDQGTESLVASAPAVKLSAMLEDIASSLKSTPLVVRMLEDTTSQEQLPLEYSRHGAGAYCASQQQPRLPQQEALQVREPRDRGAGPEAAESGQFFENAFIVHGIKHICDNLLRSLLARMKL